jgi:hypothetical protein
LALGVFQAGGAGGLLSVFGTASLMSQQNYEDAQAAHLGLPKGAKLGGVTSSSAYAFPGRRFVHLAGIYSPDMLTPSMVTNLERMKARPELRFDCWVLTGNNTLIRGGDVAALCGERAPIGIDGAHLAPARWEALDRACQPLKADVGAWALADSLDVGCPEDEARCGYETYSRFHGARFEPCAVSWGTGTNAVFDVGRAVLGSDSLTLRVRPGVPLKVVMRTAAKAEVLMVRGAQEKGQTFTFCSPLKMRVQMDGVDAGLFEVVLASDEKTFSDVSFVIPAEAVKHASPRISFCGDHAAFAYWFYQPRQ